MSDGMPIGSSGNGMVDGGFTESPPDVPRKKVCRHCKGKGGFYCTSRTLDDVPNCWHDCPACKGECEDEDNG